MAELQENGHNLYRHFDAEGHLLYVGTSLNALNRIGGHKNNSTWYKSIANMTIERFDCKENALKAERKAITEEHPLHNVYRPPEADFEDLRTKLTEIDLVFKLERVAEIFQVSTDKIKNYINDGKLKSINLGDKTHKNGIYPTLRVTGKQLIEFIEGLENGEIEV